MKNRWLVVFMSPDSRFPRVFVVEMTDKQAVALEKALQREYVSCSVSPDSGAWSLKEFLAESELKI